MESIDAGINGAKAAVNLGKATTPAMDRFYNAMNIVREESVKVVTSGVNTGNISYERIASVKLQDYVYWSAPVSGFDVNSISPLTL